MTGKAFDVPVDLALQWRKGMEIHKIYYLIDDRRLGRLAWQLKEDEHSADVLASFLRVLFNNKPLNAFLKVS